MKTKTKLLILLCSIALLGGIGAILFLGGHGASGAEDDACICDISVTEEDLELCDIAYSDIISFIVQGYKCRWDGFSPDEMGLSYVYAYESEFCGFCQADIDGDGVPELLIGDDFGEGNYAIYDIFTFDVSSRSPMHLLCGGERDSFVIGGRGVIIETGSNSAEDSFTRFYEIMSPGLVEIDCAEDDIMTLEFDHFMRYVAPGCYVALEEGEVLGQLVRTLDEGYEIEAQDVAVRPKEGICIEFWSAWDGKGVVFLQEPGTAPVHADADAGSEVIGTVVYEEGYCPDSYPCLGYTPGWFKIESGASEGFVPEAVCSWDFADRF